MNYKKIILAVVLIVITTSVLHAQVNFQQEFSFDKLNTTDNLKTIQLYDYDNDGIEDIAAQYWDYICDFWQMVIYNQNGDTLKTIHLDDWTYYGYNKFSLYKSGDSNNLIRASLGYDPHKLTIYIHDCETLLLLDSLVIFPEHQDRFSEVNSVDYYNNVSDKLLYIGANEINLMREDETKSHIYAMKIINDTLSYFDCLLYGGISNTFYSDFTFLSIGEYSYALVGAWPSGHLRYYLQRVPIDSISSAVQLHSTSGSVIWYDTTTTYYHYPKNYNIITQNCQDDFSHVLQYRKLDTDNGNSVHFKAYDTTEWQEIWSKTDTQIGLGHYVMYFRGDKLEIRDRIDGNIVHHQDSVLAVSEILRKSDGELLFFVEKLDETGYDVYSLDGPIFVSNDEPPAQNEVVLQNLPNPFSTSTTISFYGTTNYHELSQISIYNIKGQLVRELLPVAPSPVLPVSVTWDGKDNNGKEVIQGIYFYKLKVDEKDFVGKMIKIN